MKAPLKARLDALMFERGLTESRQRAKAVIMSGNVYIDGKRAEKPGLQVASDISIEVRGISEYVSRGGYKLKKALTHFRVSPEGRVCLDCGAGAGGFTDCLLKNGARLVYAVDVGYGQLAWNIRKDPRVITMERTNIRYAAPGMFEIMPDLAVIDVSFISLALVLPKVRELLTDTGEVLCLIKPQFEAGREKVGKKGVVRDPVTHIAVLDSFLHYALESSFQVKGITWSPIKGPEGNIEFLGWLRRQGKNEIIDTAALVRQSHEELYEER